MEIKEAIKLIRKYKPTTPKAFDEIGVELMPEAVGAGAFREVIKACDLDLVVKFPLNEAAKGKPEDYHEGIAHSALEMDKLGRLRKHKWMRPFLPKIHYYDRKNGIIVMQFYEVLEGKALLDSNQRLVETLIRRCTGVTVSDYWEGNVGKGSKKIRGTHVPIIIDLGY